MPQINTNNTRRAGCYVAPRYISRSYQNSFFPKISSFWSKLSKTIQNEGIPVLHDSISGNGWDFISGGKKVGELHGRYWKFEA